jgi:hypothetical protein
VGDREWRARRCPTYWNIVGPRACRNISQNDCVFGFC